MENYEWQLCPECWGQRSIFEQALNGEGLIPTTCTRCCGVGHTIELNQEALAA